MPHPALGLLPVVKGKGAVAGAGPGCCLNKAAFYLNSDAPKSRQDNRGKEITQQTRGGWREGEKRERARQEEGRVGQGGGTIQRVSEALGKDTEETGWP